MAIMLLYTTNTGSSFASFFPQGEDKGLTNHWVCTALNVMLQQMVIPIYVHSTYRIPISNEVLANV